MANPTQPTDEERAAARHYLLRFEVDMLRSRPLWIRPGRCRRARPA